MTAGSDALAVVESKSWLARQEAASVVEYVARSTLEEIALIFFHAEIVARRAELEVTLSFF